MRKLKNWIACWLFKEELRQLEHAWSVLRMKQNAGRYCKRCRTIHGEWAESGKVMLPGLY